TRSARDNVARRDDVLRVRVALILYVYWYTRSSGSGGCTACVDGWNRRCARARAVEVGRGDQCGPCRGDREPHARDRRDTTCDGPPRRAGRDYSAVRTVRFPQEDYPREGPRDLVALVRQDRPLASVSGHADS